MAEHAHTTPTFFPHVTASTPPASRRRTLFAAAGAVIMGGGITAGAAASVADLVQINPDTILIGLCDRYCIVRDEVNRDIDISDDDPRWGAYFAVCDEITDWQPVTVEGLIAKARVTKEDASNPDGTEDLETIRMDWAWDVINGLIRLGGRA